MIDRRSFIKTLLGAVAASTVDIENLISTTSHLLDDDFVMYITHTMKLYVHNPSKCFYIDNIVEPKGY